jgi:hypothetical protein
MTRALDYLTVFTDDGGRSLAALTGELHVLLSATPTPRPDYRERLRSQLLAAARDERFYRGDVSRRFVLAMAIVLSVLVSVVGVIAWRSLGERTQRA